MEQGSLEVLGKSKLTRSDGLWPGESGSQDVQSTLYILDESVKV